MVFGEGRRRNEQRMRATITSMVAVKGHIPQGANGSHAKRTHFHWFVAYFRKAVVKVTRKECHIFLDAFQFLSSFACDSGCGIYVAPETELTESTGLPKVCVVFRLILCFRIFVPKPIPTVGRAINRQIYDVLVVRTIFFLWLLLVSLVSSVSACEMNSQMIYGYRSMGERQLCNEIITSVEFEWCFTVTKRRSNCWIGEKRIGNQIESEWLPLLPSFTRRIPSPQTRSKLNIWF